MRTGTARLPLHGGRAPRWLFSRMVLLSREILRVMVEEYGPREVLVRVSDPSWFQALGCVLGFDWHSSGLTTTTTGALKEAVKGREQDFGIYVAGGKGAASRKTPHEILEYGERAAIAIPPADLVYASKMSAKVDNTAIQDGYQLYHHAFIFTPAGEWAVVQQGMNGDAGWARRYHWLSSGVKDFVDEPHTGIATEQKAQLVLNMVAHESEEARRASALLAAEPPEKLVKELRRAQELALPARHDIVPADIRPESFERILLTTYEHPPENFESLLSRPGVGPKTIRALALIADLVYGAKASARDPATFSFAHGGKDGIPYPVDRPTYDTSIEVLREVVDRAKLDDREKLNALGRLMSFSRETG
ncbi:MAG: DUF763 domain-containing protein [Armatimonadota bacterium]|jgi:hypothetical protein